MSRRHPFLLRSVSVSIAVLFTIAIIAAAQTKPAARKASAQKSVAHKIGSSAVWQASAEFITDAHKACDNSGAHNYAECFIEQMTKAGAPAAAVAFTRELYKFNHGDVGIMGGFQAVGPVDIAWINYPLRANTNYGLLLVNGKPAMVDVEDLKLLDTKTMKQSPQYQDAKAQFPQIDVWPGDRDGKTWPNSQKGPNGGIQFVADYPLLNGCHACARAGSVYFNWNFDANGKFTGTNFIGMTAPPLQ